MAERRGVAVVLADSAGRWPVVDRVTTGFADARLHGDTELYASGYADAALERWAEWVRRHLAAGRDAAVYFDNDAKGRAPFDAMTLRAKLER